MLTHSRCGSHAVGLIDIRGKGSVQVKRISLGKLQTQISPQVTQRSDVRSEVIRHVQPEFVNQADLLEASRVVIRLHLHFQVVLQVYRHLPCLSPTWSLVDIDVIGFVLHERHVAVSVGLLVGLEVAVAAVAEIRRIAEADRRGQDVTDTVYLVAEDLTAGDPEAIEFRIETETEAPVVHIIEARNGIRHLLLVLLVPVLLSLPEKRTVGKVDTWYNVQVPEGGEAGLDGYRVLHAVLPVARQT